MAVRTPDTCSRPAVISVDTESDMTAIDSPQEGQMCLVNTDILWVYTGRTTGTTSGWRTV